MLILLGIIVVAIVTTLSILIVRPLLIRREMIDRPGEGRSHDVVTARGGGIAILFGVLAGCALAFLDTSYVQPYGHLTAFVLGVASFSLLGWLDDVRNLPWWFRFGAQIVLSFGIAALAWKFCGMPAWLAVLVAFAGIFYVNAANFMDGINGISAMHGMVVGAFFTVLGMLLFDTMLMVAGAAVATAFAAFLPWNSPKAHIFMGDSGSYLLGASVWGLAWWALCSPAVQAPLWVVIAPVLIYSVDVLWTLASRALRGENLTERHREHIFTRFSDKTSHLTSALVVTMLTAICCVAGLLIQWPLTEESKNQTIGAVKDPIALAVMLLCVVCYLSLPLAMSKTPNTDADKFEIGE